MSARPPSARIDWTRKSFRRLCCCTAAAAEWVEIANQTRRAVNLDGWTLRDADGHRYRFDNVRLAGRATVRIHTGIGRDTRTDLFQDRRTYVWDNNGDTATLRDARGRTVDTDSWGRNHHHR
ncbi:lamin tail domain-containing protein [Streptomyces sp. NPDC001822]|uniref:lamin tail domain-containing protein n=1 Tax=Streptomyces sp. NPDC001822 TaxID=3364614 RepID=UPI0036D0DEBE